MKLEFHFNDPRDQIFHFYISQSFYKSSLMNQSFEIFDHYDFHSNVSASRNYVYY